MSHFVTAGDFIKDVRVALGDTTCAIPEDFIISALNLTLTRLARARGLARLFKFQDTIELASINKDGSKAAAWKLNTDNVGSIIDMESLLVLDSSSCGMCDANLCYLPYSAFRKQNPFPESKNPGSPCEYTINQIGGDSIIIFDRPVSSPYSVDMVYYAFHPRIKNINDMIRIDPGYLDIIKEATKIQYLKESADFASARALLEDYDMLVAEARELLAKQPEHLAYRRVGGAV